MVQKPTDDYEEEVLDFKAACRFLGISENTLRDMVAKRELPVHKVRNRLRFLKSELIEWLKEQ